MVDEARHRSTPLSTDMTGSRPFPDPTDATTQQLFREISSLRDSVIAHSDSNRSVMEARIDGMSKAVEVFQADLTRVPTQLDRAVTGLRELIDSRIHNLDALMGRFDVEHQRLLAEIKDISINGHELAAVTAQRFTGVAEQFRERDTRTDQRAGDTKLAVDAAFAAAKEATAKIEAGFTKSIDALQELLKATAKSSDDKIDDLRGRLTGMEARAAGVVGANTENRIVNTDNSARMMAIFAVAVAFVVGVAEIIARVIAH